MRVMPFRVAEPGSVQFTEPRLHLHDLTHVPGDPVPTWDYLAETRVTSTVTVDAPVLLPSTGIPATDLLSATLQVDSPATGFRRVQQVPLGVAADPVLLEMVIGPHLVASTLEVRLGVVLNASLPGGELAAHQKGSRVHTDPRVYRFTLEGTGGGFPTEAFDFEKAGYPPGAAWRLNLKTESLDLSFSAAVRLQINTGHSKSRQLLAGKPGVVQSVLFHGVLEHMLLAVADAIDPEDASGHDNGSFGAVLDELTQHHLGLSLSETMAALGGGDRSRILAKLQEVTSFLDGDAL